MDIIHLVYPFLSFKGYAETLRPKSLRTAVSGFLDLGAQMWPLCVDEPSCTLMIYAQLCM